MSAPGYSGMGVCSPALSSRFSIPLTEQVVTAIATMFLMVLRKDESESDGDCLIETTSQVRKQEQPTAYVVESWEQSGIKA